jgi:hypothetical protein
LVGLDVSPAHTRVIAVYTSRGVAKVFDTRGI